MCHPHQKKPKIAPMAMISSANPSRWRRSYRWSFSDMVPSGLLRRLVSLRRARRSDHHRTGFAPTVRTVLLV
ncbi:hypothetical protein GCM10009660_19880 [Catellatospora bangladeshensis]